MNIEDCNETSSSAIIEYFEIESVVRAIDALDNRKLGISNDYVSLAFFESISTNSILVHRIALSVDLEILKRQCSIFGYYRNFAIDHSNRCCLVTYDTLDQAKQMIKFLKDFYQKTKELQVDFASLECTSKFNKNLGIVCSSTYSSPNSTIASSNTSSNLISNQIDNEANSNLAVSPNCNLPNGSNHLAQKTIQEIDADLMKLNESDLSLIDYICQSDDPFINDILTGDEFSNNQFIDTTHTSTTSSELTQSSPPYYQSNASSSPASDFDNTDLQVTSTNDQVTIECTNYGYIKEEKLFIVDPVDSKPKCTQRQQPSPVVKPERKVKIIDKLQFYQDPYNQLVNPIGNNLGKVSNPYYENQLDEPMDDESIDEIMIVKVINS